MDKELLKRLGNIDQVAGIRVSKILSGHAKDVIQARVYNAAGLSYTVIPDLGMGIYDLSYKGMNLSFHAKNGMISPDSFSAQNGEFVHQWPGGFLYTCGLDNVGGHCEGDDIYPTHGRFGAISAEHFGTQCCWDGEDYVLRTFGEVHQTKLYGSHLSLRRCIETSLNAKTLRIHDVITNFEGSTEPYMLLYHINFGYPLLDKDTRVFVGGKQVDCVSSIKGDPAVMMDPEDGRGEECFLYTQLKGKVRHAVYNRRLGVGVELSYDAENLPNLLEWKNMKTHDYVVALEPCNTWVINRSEAVAQDKMAYLPPFASVENEITVRVFDTDDPIWETLP